MSSVEFGHRSSGPQRRVQALSKTLYENLIPKKKTKPRRIPLTQNETQVHWLAVDQLGDLYFTGSVDNSVMTIPLGTLKKLESGELTSWAPFPQGPQNLPD